MEKKLTDEEVAQALLQNIEYSKALTYFDKWGNQKTIMITDIIDFIHSLQDKKKELKSIAEYQQCSNMERWQIIQEKDKTIAEQKAEIERLTEYNANLNGMCLEFIDKNAELQKQVDELKAKQIIECYGMLKGCDIVNQAVKDTAKEILQMIDDDRSGYWDSCDCGKDETYWRDNSIQGTLNEIKKRYGLEVE